MLSRAPEQHVGCQTLAYVTVVMRWVLISKCWSVMFSIDVADVWLLMLEVIPFIHELPWRLLITFFFCAQLIVIS